jgi:hypothetical protein
MEAMTPGVVIVEVLGSHDRVQSRERLPLAEGGRRFTIGRSARADVILDDPYCAALHAEIEIAPDGTLRVTDLGTTNGIIVSGERHRGVQAFPLPEGSLQVGHTRLRVRTPSEALPPERPDHAWDARRGPAWTATGAGLACAAYVGYLGWLEAPRDLTTVVVTMLLTALFACGVWIGFWALLSRVMLGEWHWIRHAAILFGVTAGFVAVQALLDIGWFVYSLPASNSRDLLLGAAAFGIALYWHLSHASHLNARRAVAIAALIPAFAAGAGWWVQARVQARNVNYIDSAEKIFPPALRLRAASELGEYFNSVALLKAAADARRAAIPADDESDSAFGGEFARELTE